MGAVGAEDADTVATEVEAVTGGAAEAVEAVITDRYARIIFYMETLELLPQALFGFYNRFI